MALRFIEAVDLFDYVEAIKTARSFADFTVELNVGGTGGWSPVYDAARDRILLSVEPLVGADPEAFSIDPLLLDTSAPRVIQGPLNGRQVPLYVGYYDRALGTQNVYHSTNGYVVGVSVHNDMAPLTLGDTGASFGAAAPFLDQSRVGLGVGFFDGNRNWLFFEGLTDGVPGETLQTGSGVYPQGLGLVTVDDGQIDTAFGVPFDGVGQNADDVVGWVDLATGELEGALLNTAGRAGAFTTELFVEPPIAGASFRWYVSQFVPDIDSVPTSPKGELILVSRLGDNPYSSSFDQACFVKIIDFNPFAKVAASGAPFRQHERETLKSAVEFNENPLFGLAGFVNSAAQFPATDDAIDLLYHPPTRRFMMVVAPSSGIPSPGVNATLKQAIAYWARAVDPSVVGSPVALDVPETNSVTELSVFVGGNLGESVGGERVAITIDRRSTLRETLTGAFTPASTSTVANVPIDANFAGDPEGTLVVEADGVVLVETTDYTVVLSTGVITWVTDQSSAALVTATYQHETVGATFTAAYGTLLTTEVVTNANGFANVQVSWPDDLDLTGHLFDITSALAT